MRESATTLQSRAGLDDQLGAATAKKHSQGHFAGKSMNPEQQNIGADAQAARFRHQPATKPLDGYTIKRGIGIGGFGEVYFAISDAGKEVALKRIQRNLDVELRGVQNCLNLKHLNLISLWDIRTDGAGDSWVVMEYVPGPSLRDIIEVSENGMPGHQIERWFTPIANGVGYLHDSGIVHRDLKPANIFLDEDENVIKIGDYGLSKFISGSEGSRQTETVGTFHYMAPEIGKGSYGKGIDIYAMGIVLFEMLTGNVPFRGESSQEIIMKHLTSNPDLSAVPFDFREAIQRSLEKDPDERFGSIDELKECLPWNSVNGNLTVLNSERFNLRDTVGTGPNSKDRSSSGAAKTADDSFERSRSEGGILFGPLRDSNVGNGEVRNEVLYIESEHRRDAAAAAPIQKQAEPIAEAVRTGIDGVADWWNDTSVSTPLKTFALLVSGVAVVLNSEWLLPTALAIGLVYLMYFGVRHVILATPESELQPKKLSRRKQKQLLETGIRNQLASLDFLTHATVLTGSLLVSAAVCLALNLLGLAIVDSIFASSVDSWALFAWSTIVSVVGSWTLLVLGKYYEITEVDWLQGRVTMVVIGTWLGGVALMLAAYFNIDFSAVTEVGFNPLLPAGLSYSGANPLVVNVLFFASVFGLLRWWRQVEPGRRTRLSVWSIGLCLIWAALFSHLLNFLPLLTTMIVVIISVAAQLAAPWVNYEQRQQMLQRKGV